MMMEKDLEESQTRVGKEDGTRDRHPSQNKTTMVPRTMNSLGCSLESGPTPYDNEPESQWNLLPCSKMRNTKISTCGD